ncbi:MAG TPA: TonB-dependent receptor [Bryobacteraceae bacterium]|nr:TonB-dependent receptor [Bryobacteraceae bacterium]
MRFGKRSYLALVLCAWGMLEAPAIWGQPPGGFGAVGGEITDPTGDGLPDARIVLSNASLGIQRPMDGTDDGVFYLPAVTPAEGYKLKVTRRNFTSWESGEFSVGTGQEVNFAIILYSTDNGAKNQPLGIETTVNNTINSIGGAVSQRATSDTPSSQRLLDPLATLAPAATEAVTKPGVIVFHGVPFSNQFLTDGILSTDMYPLYRAGIANQLSQDAVQDMYTASGNFLSEYGTTSGGIVDAGTRSGTTDYHGEAWGYFRDSGWQANDRFAAGHNTHQQQEQAGANVGGPIRNNVFFFLNFDWLNRSGQGLNRITNPLIADPTGTQVLASNCQATAAQCAIASRFLQSQMNVLEPLDNHSYRGLAKIDWRKSNRNNISFEGNALQWKAPALAETETVAPNGGMIGDPNLKEQTRFARVAWTATGSPQVTNDLRLGFYQDRLTESPVATGLSTGTLGINIAGTTVGATQAYPAVLPSERRFQATDNGHWTLGSHTIEAGANETWTRDYINYLPDQGGLYNYPSLTAFALDFSRTALRTYTSFQQTLGTGARSLSPRDLGVYAQDTWRGIPRLTISYGLRYERPHFTQPVDVNTNYYLTGSIATPDFNLAPRFGAAFQVDPKTVVRAGYGWYYQPVSGQLMDALYLGNGIYQSNILVTPSLTGAPVFPNVIPNTGSIPNGSLNLTYALTNFKQPYVQEMYVAAEREIMRDTTLTVNFIHNRGYRLWTTQDFNQANPTSAQATTETYNIENTAGQVTGTYTTQFWFTKNNGNFAHVFQIENGGSSWYNAGNVQLRKRMSHGVSVIATYTWSHATDDIGQLAPFGTAFSSTFDATYTADRGRSAFDQRNRGTVQWLWQPTARNAASPAMRYLLNGWQVSGLATLASSMYETPIVVVQGQQFTGVSMTYTSTLNGSGGWDRVPFLPIQSLPTGPIYNVDARLAKTFPIGERIRATLLFEGFNVFNMQYTTQVNTIAYTSVAMLPSGLLNGPRTGTLLPVPGLGAPIAAQGFPDGTNARRLQVGLRIVF